MRRLDTMIEEINSSISPDLKYPKAIYYNQAELQVKDDRTFPMVNNGNGKGTVISLDKRIALQCYHRVISSITETDPTGGKGRFPYTMRIYTLRAVWIGSLVRLPQKAYETNDDVKNDVYEAFPTVLSGNEKIRTVSENVDKLDIMNTEFANNNLSQLTLDVVLFTIDYELSQKVRCQT